MHKQLSRYVLALSCPEKKGIVKEVSNFLYDIDATIIEAAQHGDFEANRFFLRMEFVSASKQPLLSLDEFKQKFGPIAKAYSMGWTVNDANIPTNVVIAVSKLGHCLNDVLHRWKMNLLPIDIKAVVSNHDDMHEMVDWYGLPFHHLPVTKDNKREQENQILTIMKESNAELLLLARYMQILSDYMCGALSGKAINIHHSFLPSFKGAKPYHQAFERGVKIIGATVHYVTRDLDDGPIIEQCVERVDHQFTPEKLAQVGRDNESVAFARAIKWHCEHRVILNGNRTIVFK